MSTTPFFAAIQSEDLYRLRELLAIRPELASSRNDDGVSAVLFALYHRRGDALALILGASPQIGLHEAAALGRTERVVTLLEAEPSRLDEPGVDGFAPLHLAAFFGRRETVAALLTRGAKVSAPAANPSRVQPIHSAVAKGDLRVVAGLLQAGADPNARQQGGYTPLMGAAAAGNRELVRLLLERGADPAAQSDDGQTAEDIAIAKGHEELATIFP